MAGPTTPITNVLTVYTYTVAGGLANIQDGRGKVSSFAYDLLDRQVSAADPLAHTTVDTYNEAGDRIAMLDANGQVINYTYDLLDRQTAITYPAGIANVVFAYDVLSQRTAMTDGTGTIAWVFDAVGRPITITQPNVGNVSYGYDSAGDRTSLSYPDGKVVTYTYDLAVRLANVTDWQAKLQHPAPAIHHVQRLMLMHTHQAVAGDPLPLLGQVVPRRIAGRTPPQSNFGYLTPILSECFAPREVNPSSHPSARRDEPGLATAALQWPGIP